MIVVADKRPHVRLSVVLALVAVALVPWAAVLGLILPTKQVARHWDVVWSGFDVALSVSLLTTAFGALRERDWLPIAATASGTLLVCDAWFDALTAWTGTDLGMSLALAALVEIPLAGLCFLLAVRARAPADTG